jgi:hypothetical protein
LRFEMPAGLRSPLRVVGLSVLLAGALLASLSSGTAAAQGVRDVPVFSISKSENKNQVQFAVRLDSHCAPVGERPVYAYWRMLEKGFTVTEELLACEQPAYGIEAQAVRSRGEWEGSVELRLRALTDRRIMVRSYRTEGGCAARAETTIEGALANLYNVHALLRWPFGVDRIYVSGWAADDGRLLRETVSP